MRVTHAHPLTCAHGACACRVCVARVVRRYREREAGVYRALVLGGAGALLHQFLLKVQPPGPLPRESNTSPMRVYAHVHTLTCMACAWHVCTGAARPARGRALRGGRARAGRLRAGGAQSRARAVRRSATHRAHGSPCAPLKTRGAVRVPRAPQVRQVWQRGRLAGRRRASRRLPLRRPAVRATAEPERAAAEGRGGGGAAPRARRRAVRAVARRGGGLPDRAAAHELRMVPDRATHTRAVHRSRRALGARVPHGTSLRRACCCRYLIGASVGGAFLGPPHRPYAEVWLAPPEPVMVVEAAAPAPAPAAVSGSVPKSRKGPCALAARWVARARVEALAGRRPATRQGSARRA